MKIRRSLLLAVAVGVCSPADAQQLSTTFAGPGAPSTVAYAGPGDVTGWTTGVIAWWGLRPYSHAYALAGGNIANICEASSGLHCVNATANVNGTITIPNVNGNPCDNSTHQCEIAILYDQSGATSCTNSVPAITACDITGTHGSSRPILVVNCIGSLPCFTGTTGSMSSNPNSLTTTVNEPFTQTAVAKRNTGAGIGALMDANNGALESLFSASADTIELFAGSGVPSTPATDGTVHTFNFVFQSGTNITKLQVDSSAFVTGTLSASAVSLIGSQNFAFPSITNGALTGQLFEGGWWAGDKSPSSGFANIHANQCAYWGTTC